MPIELNDLQARVVGCLMEKSVITPDQYPMTLNALTNACNQKSSRDPVMNLSQGDVQHTLRALEGKHLVRTEENFRSQIDKYSHRLCNTPFSSYQFDSAEFAVITVLLLRGPRTPGELRANSGRLHTFADNAEVEQTLQQLIQREEGAVVVQLPRSPGRRDHEYMHLFGTAQHQPAEGTADATGKPPLTQPGPAAQAGNPQRPAVPGASAPGDGVAEQAGPDPSTLEQRVAELEAQVADLRRQMQQLTGQLPAQSKHEDHP